MNLVEIVIHVLKKKKIKKDLYELNQMEEKNILKWKKANGSTGSSDSSETNGS